MEGARILVVEDTKVFAAYLKKNLEKLGYVAVAMATNGEEAIEKAAQLHPDLALMDVSLASGLDGIETAKQIKTRFDIPVIYLTASTDMETLERAKIS